MLLMIVGIALTFLAYYLTDSLLYAAVFLVAWVALSRTLQPFVDKLRFTLFPIKEIVKFRELGMDAEDKEEIQGRGMRLCVITMGTKFDAGEEKSAALYEGIVSDAAAAVTDRSEIFTRSYREVLARELPQEYTWSVCGEKGNGARKSYKYWLYHIASKYFGAWKENKELFMTDVLYKDPKSGEDAYAAVCFMFEPRLARVHGRAITEERAAPEAEGKTEKDL